MLKLFFTNRYFRWVFIERIKLQIISLPIIHYIYTHIKAHKINRRFKDLSSWERYLAIKNYENQGKLSSFIVLLIALKACMMPSFTDKELFQKVKNNILEMDLINESEYTEFKSWLKEIDFTQRNADKVQEVIDSFDLPSY